MMTEASLVLVAYQHVLLVADLLEIAVVVSGYPIVARTI